MQHDHHIQSLEQYLNLGPFTRRAFGIKCATKHFSMHVRFTVSLSMKLRKRVEKPNQRTPLFLQEKAYKLWGRMSAAVQSKGP